MQREIIEGEGGGNGWASEKLLNNMQRENKEDPRLEENGLAINPNPEAIYQRENKWQDRFALRFQKYHIATDCEAKCLDEFELYEILEEFIHSEIDTARAEEREEIKKELKQKLFAVGDYYNFDKEDILNLIK